MVEPPTAREQARESRWKDSKGKKKKIQEGKPKKNPGEMKIVPQGMKIESIRFLELNKVEEENLALDRREGKEEIGDVENLKSHGEDTRGAT